MKLNNINCSVNSGAWLYNYNNSNSVLRLIYNSVCDSPQDSVRDSVVVPVRNSVRKSMWYSIGDSVRKGYN